MAKHTKYYEVLGVSPSADDAEIKRGYKKMAMKWHPDKNPENKAEAEEKFKAISQAYQVLTDPQKKKIYDQYGEEGLQGGGGDEGGFRDAHSMFADLFGFGDMFGGGFFRGGRQGPARTPDIQFELGVTLADLYTGCTKKLKVQRDVICVSCEGKGGQEGALKTCDRCEGRGQEVIVNQPRPGFIQQSITTCRKCQGRKEIVNEKLACKECKGTKVVKRATTLDVNVEKGMVHGEKIRFREAADQAPGIQAGDIVVVLSPKSDPTRDTESKAAKAGQKLRPSFVRMQNGKDLVFEHEISLTEALIGYEIILEHFDNHVVQISSPTKHVTNVDEVIVVEGEGMPVKGKNLEKGDLLVKLKIRMPTYEELGGEAGKGKLLAALPAAPRRLSDGKAPGNALKYTAQVFDLAAAKQKRDRERTEARTKHSETYEEDEDGGEARTATCRQQ